MRFSIVCVAVAALLPSVALAGDYPLQDYLRITELNYNPYDPTAAEIAQGFDENNDFE